MKNKNISIKTIFDRITRHPLMSDTPKEYMADYTEEFIRIVGMPNILEEKVATIDVKDYRAELPKDFIQVQSVRNYNGVTYKSTTDTFFLSDKCNDSNTYKIQGGVIFTDRPDVQLEISYLAIPLDNEGYPMIPDNSSFLRALEAYIKKQVFTVLFDTGKIHPTVLQNATKEYAWAVGDCQTEANRLSLDDAESFYKKYKELLPVYNRHKNSFR